MSYKGQKLSENRKVRNSKYYVKNRMFLFTPFDNEDVVVTIHIQFLKGRNGEE